MRREVGFCDSHIENFRKYIGRELNKTEKTQCFSVSADTRGRLEKSLDLILMYKVYALGIGLNRGA
jgi:hypothetical protein